MPPAPMERRTIAVSYRAWELVTGGVAVNDILFIASALELLGMRPTTLSSKTAALKIKRISR
jgi:hypothetical protein